jgi:hypothetical protein
LSDTRTGILGSIAGPCDFLPARSDEFEKVWYLLLPKQAWNVASAQPFRVFIFENMAGRVLIVPITDSV